MEFINNYWFLIMLLTIATAISFVWLFFMPFITEEIWHAIAERKDDDDIIIAQQPRFDRLSDQAAAVLKQMEFTQEVINNVRKVRSDKNIAFRDAIKLVVKGTADKDFDCVIAKLCNVSEVNYVAEAPAGAFGFIVGSTEFFVPLTDSVDVEAFIWSYKPLDDNSVQTKIDNICFPPLHTTIASAGGNIVTCSIASVGLDNAYAYDCNAVL